MITLKAKSIWYYSAIDEELFFHWISKIPALKEFKLVNDETVFYIKSKKISDSDLIEVIALFYKYKINMTQLQIFLNSKNKHWFSDNKKAFWHRRVWGTKKAPQTKEGQ